MSGKTLQSTRPPATARAPVVVYDVDPAHSSAEFAIKHLMIATVKGRFRIARASIVHDPDAPEQSVVEAEIDVASVDTGAEPRDEHLRSADFFDAERHPRMVFRSTSVEPQDDDRLEVRGDLTIRGVTHPVALAVLKEGEVARDPWGKARVAVTATTTLDRTRWGLTWNQALEAGGVLVGDKVKVTLSLSMVRRD